MSARPEGLLSWQWRGYARNHNHPRSLLLHIVAVPMFMAGNVLLVYGVLLLSVPAVGLGVLCMALSMMLQGRGHRLEAVRPETVPPSKITVPRSAIRAGHLCMAA